MRRNTTLHAAAIAALAMLACSTPKEAPVYERGTLTRPPPAKARPGVGLPRYDPQVKPLPPQPQPKYERYLPPEPDGKPGIWASEEPKGSILPAAPLLFGVLLPYPEVDAKEDRAIADVCAFTMRAASVDTNIQREPWRKWDTTVRACLSARLYEHCASRFLQHYQDLAARAERLDKTHERMASLTVAKAEEFRRRVCHGPLPEDAASYGRDVITAWEKYFRTYLRDAWGEQ